MAGLLLPCTPLKQERVQLRLGVRIFWQDPKNQEIHQVYFQGTSSSLSSQVKSPLMVSIVYQLFDYTPIKTGITIGCFEVFWKR